MDGLEKFQKIILTDICTLSDQAPKDDKQITMEKLVMDDEIILFPSVGVTSISCKSTQKYVIFTTKRLIITTRQGNPGYDEIIESYPYKNFLNTAIEFKDGNFKEFFIEHERGTIHLILGDNVPDIFGHILGCIRKNMLA